MKTVFLPHKNNIFVNREPKRAEICPNSFISIPQLPGSEVLNFGTFFRQIHDHTDSTERTDFFR